MFNMIDFRLVYVKMMCLKLVYRCSNTGIHVQENHKHLTKTKKTGTYGYYRRIPSVVKVWFPAHTKFLKKSFKTKDFHVAYGMMRELDARFSRLELISADQSDGSQDAALSGARLLVEQILWNPAEAKTDDDWEAARRHNYEEAVGLLEDGGYIENSHEGWVALKNPDDRDPKALAAMLILEGKEDWDFATNLQDVLDVYLRENLKKTRNAKQVARVKQSVPSLFNKLAEHLPHGLHTHVEELERSEVKRICEKIWPNASTRMRNTGTFSSVINAWNTEQPKKLLSNVFKGLVKQGEVDGVAKERRSFTPEELNLYRKSLRSEADREIGLVGLMMIELGVANGEALGLVRKDVKLKANTPHVIFRDNAIRVLGKKRLPRAVPIVGELLDQMNEYVESLPTDWDLLFPNWFDGDGPTFSNRLSGHITNTRPLDEQISPYSARHTFKDRYEKAKVPTVIGEFLMGHKSKGSSGVHKRYGTMTPPDLFVEYMSKIAGVTVDHGYFEEYD